jgi:hypothetical protein
MALRAILLISQAAEKHNKALAREAWIFQLFHFERSCQVLLFSFHEKMDDCYANALSFAYTSPLRDVMWPA